MTSENSVREDVERSDTGGTFEEVRQQAQMLDRFSTAALTSANVDDFAQELLDLFAELAGVQVGLVRLTEGSRLRSRAKMGLEDASVAEQTTSIDDGLPRDVTTLVTLPLREGDRLAGVVYLGAPQARTLEPQRLALLEDLAARSGVAVRRITECETLREGIRSRDQVLGVVAHDLRNPINVIALAANSLLLRGPESAARRPIERIARAAQRAERLVQDLLDINAIEADRFSIEVRTVETADTILAALESQQSLAADASIIIATDLSPELPAIEADEERLLEVLENLIGNALKFTSPGGSVTLGASAQEGEILFSVKDSGPGITDEQKEHLFDRFWQAKKTDRRGAGLGLTICRAIVDAHGGRIWADSKPGEGTTMCFTIPSVARAPKTDALEVANVLLVDDRPENLLSLKAILERPAYRLFTARSGPEALGLVLREQFEVILLDIAMPGMNGLEVATHLKTLERSRDIPIIFVTAYGDDPKEIHRAYSAGGADYLVKPLDAEIVRKKVAVFVDLSRRRLAGGQPQIKDV